MGFRDAVRAELATVCAFRRGRQCTIEVHVFLTWHAAFGLQLMALLPVAVGGEMLLSTSIPEVLVVLVCVAPWCGHFVGAQAGSSQEESTNHAETYVCDGCQWTSPHGAFYDLSVTCDRKYEVAMDNLPGAQIHFGVCGTVDCGEYSTSRACLNAPGSEPTSTGQSYKFEALDANIPAAGVRLLLTDGEICSITKQPRKTIIDFECQASVSRQVVRSQPKPLRAWEGDGDGDGVCTYRVLFRSSHGCPTRKNKYSQPSPSITAVTGCIDSVPKLSTSACHPAGGTELTIHGVDFLTDPHHSVGVDIFIGSYQCGNVRVINAWTIVCHAPAGTKEGHKISANFKIKKETRLHSGATPEIYIEEVYVASHSATVSYKPLVDYRERFDSFMELGVGGLTPQIQQLYQRAFASRCIPASVLTQLGIEHAKGILLHGPPGSGKTLLARTIAKILKTEQVSMINAPEIMSKFLGESEKNLRSHFEAAEKDWLELGESSDLHVIIIDEIDAICKPRGKSDSSAAAAAYDSVVNQLLTKMDGLKSLHNILVIGMTNRRDMIDAALLRPGRFEIQIEIGLPDEKGRWEIFSIHTRKMQESGYLAGDLDLEQLAKNTTRFSGAEIAGLVRLAASFALDRRYGSDADDPSLVVTRADFKLALEQFQPAYTERQDVVLEEFLPRGFWQCGREHSDIVRQLWQITTSLKTSLHSAIDSVLLYGARGVGKSGLAAQLATLHSFTFVKVVKPTSLVRLSSAARAETLIEVFHDAFKAKFGLLILDDLHHLIELVTISDETKVSSELLHTLATLMSSQPRNGHRLLVVATLFSENEKLTLSPTGRVGLQQLFSHQIYVPAMNMEAISEILGHSGFLNTEGWFLSLPMKVSLPLKTVLRVIECMDQRHQTEGTERGNTPQGYLGDCLNQFGQKAH